MSVARARAGIFLVFTLSALLLPGLAAAQEPAAKVGAALGEMDSWLGQSPHAAGWHAALQTDQLRAQLGQGSAANPAVVTQVLCCYCQGTAGLELAPFVQVRNSVAEWLASLPSPSTDQLAAAARASKTAFLPRTATDLEQARQRLAAALPRLEARLQEGGAEAPGWRAYLKLDELNQHLAQPAPDLAALDASYARFAAGYEGLGLAAFADVRDALRCYVRTARAMTDPNVRQQYEKLLDMLAQRLEAYRKDPTPDNAAAIALALGWLRDLGQAPWLIAAIQRGFSFPNVFVNVSGQLVSSRLGRTVDDTSAVQDCILGTAIYGTAHATGQVRGELVPCEGQAVIDAMFSGPILSNSVGYNGPATIYSTSQTNLAARKRIVLNADGVFGLPAASGAATCSNIYCIDTGGRALVERIAWRRAMKQKSEAEAIASQHAQWRFNQRMDQQSEPMITKANEGFQKRFHGPLTERNLFPELFQASTTDQSLQVTVMTTGENGLGAPTAPPELTAAPDLAVRVHESSVNNLTAQAVSGMTIDAKRFEQIATRFLGLPERIGKSEDEENWAITFARQQPVTLQFVNGGFVVTIRGDQYMSEGKESPAMNVTARYRIEHTPRGFRAVRQGPLEAYPPGFVPESGQQLSASDQARRTVLQRRFARFFEEELPIKNLVIGKDTQQPVELQMTGWDAYSGWMVMTWQALASPQAAPAAHALAPSPKTAPAAPMVSD